MDIILFNSLMNFGGFYQTLAFLFVIFCIVTCLVCWYQTDHY